MKNIFCNRPCDSAFVYQQEKQSDLIAQNVQTPQQKRIQEWYNRQSDEQKESLKSELEEQKSLLRVFNDVWKFLDFGGRWESLNLLFTGDEAIIKMLKGFNEKPTNQETLEYHIKLLKALDSPFVPNWIPVIGESDKFIELGNQGVQYFVGIDATGKLVRGNIANFSFVQDNLDDGWFLKGWKSVQRVGEKVLDAAGEATIKKSTKSVDDLVVYEQKLLAIFQSGSKKGESNQNGVESVNKLALWGKYGNYIDSMISWAKGNEVIPEKSAVEVYVYEKGSIIKKPRKSLGITTFDALKTHYQNLKSTLQP